MESQRENLQSIYRINFFLNFRTFLKVFIRDKTCVLISIFSKLQCFLNERLGKLSAADLKILLTPIQAGIFNPGLSQSE